VDVVGDAVVTIEVVLDDKFDNVAGEYALEHAITINDKAVAKARSITNRVIFLIFIFMFYSLLENIMEYSSCFAFTFLIPIKNYTTPR
jgi:hypothetical protein